MELGDKKVQGLDYFYTLQGTLKGTNITDIDPNTDPAKDALENTVNQYVAHDEYAFTLGFYENDYKPIDATIDLGAETNAYTNIAAEGLYNGNIAYTITDIPTFTTNPTRASKYHYDQLHRIKKSENLQFDGSNFVPLFNNADAFKTTYNYGADGNLENLIRHDKDGNIMDDLAYV